MKLAWVFLLAICHCFAEPHAAAFFKKLQAGISDWMKEQADRDLASMKGRTYSIRKICDYYEKSSPDAYLIKVVIQNGRVSFECKEKDSWGVNYRATAYVEALRTISSVARLPNVTFLLSMHDALHDAEEDVPVFAMCKPKQNQRVILVPDFEALREKFQVLANQDLTKYCPSWSTKKSQLIWRGSTAQTSLDGELMRVDNVQRFSRVILCQLAQKNPANIDAKFTLFAQGGENIPWLRTLGASMMSFEDQIHYKYHIFIDGNVSPYTGSGWKFFVNSVIFKPESSWVQWYFGALRPFEHYIPVQMDLQDLVERVQWAISHDQEASRIANSARNFALSHLTLSDNLLYLYYIISRYSDLCSADQSACVHADCVRRPY